MSTQKWGAARSVKTKTHNYIALRYTGEQLKGVRDGNRRILKSLTGLSGGVSRSVTTTPNPYVPDQLYDLRKDPTEQANLAHDRSQAQSLQLLQGYLKKELQSFSRRPYGEFIPGGNAVSAEKHADVYQRLLETARAGKQNSKRPKRTK